MVDLQFVHFAVNAGNSEERKAIQPDDFSLLDFTITSRTSHSASGFPAFPSFYNTDRPLFGDPQNFLHGEDEARNFNISDLRGRNRRLLPAVM